LYDEVGGGVLPMIVFNESLDRDEEASKALSQGLTKVGKYRKVSVGDSWNPRCMDTNGCKLDECKNTLSCRSETPNTLELFVMSQCPYGVMALDAMKEVLANLDKKLNLRVHYIANGDAQKGFQALHGQPEVDENIRGLCAAKYYAKDRKYMDYIWCRNPNIQSSDWKSCTGSNGIAAQKISACAEGKEGPQLHEEDIKVANSLSIGGSPTWIVNGRHKFSGVDAETIRRNVCQHNPALKGCDKKLSETKGQVPEGAGCGK
ncbi:MAG: GILT family protein, partial [Polyangiaceae bacterium]|nr:GILT family protein [Polyangiaceae bacterium]